MTDPKKKIVFALDVPSVEEAINYAQQLSGHVGMFKIGLELFIQGGRRVIDSIRQAGDAEIFLDLKLHDIPATVSRAMSRIAGMGVFMTTVHCGESPKMLEAAVEGSLGKVRVLGVTVLTSVSSNDLAQAGFEKNYCSDISQLVMKRAETAQKTGCSGIVCSGQEVRAMKQRFGQDFLAVTPGIRPSWELTENDDQARVVTPARAVADGADYLVIGRPIRDAADSAHAADRISHEISEGLTG